MRMIMMPTTGAGPNADRRIPTTVNARATSRVTSSDLFSLGDLSLKPALRP